MIEPEKTVRQWEKGQSERVEFVHSRKVIAGNFCQKARFQKLLACSEALMYILAWKGRSQFLCLGTLKTQGFRPLVTNQQHASKNPDPILETLAKGAVRVGNHLEEGEGELLGALGEVGAHHAGGKAVVPHQLAPAVLTQVKLLEHLPHGDSNSSAHLCQEGN